jgi:hypothetical protein
MTTVDEFYERVLPILGLTSEQVESLSATGLIELALTRPETFKVVLREFERRGLRDADGAAERLLIQAYRDGRSHGWFTAALLRCFCSRRSYELALKILVDGPGLLAESYATHAMIVIDRNRSRGDLLEVVCDKKNPPHVRRYAGDALKEIADLGMVPTIVAAVRSNRLGVARASAILRRLPIRAADVSAWLQDIDDAVARVGFAVGIHIDLIDPVLAQTMQDLMRTGRVELSPWERARVEERIADSLRT